MSYIADNLFSHMMAKKTHSKIRYSLQTAKKKVLEKKKKRKSGFSSKKEQNLKHKSFLKMAIPCDCYLH